MLDEANARPLVSALLRGIEVEPRPDLIGAIIDRSEGHPFVIQHIADKLRTLKSPRIPDVEQVLEQLLVPPSVLDLGHHATRLAKYYGDREDVALKILDELSKSLEGLHVDELARKLSTTRADLVPAIRDLRDDDYITIANSHARFTLDFVRRYWREDRMV